MRKTLTAFVALAAALTISACSNDADSALSGSSADASGQSTDSGSGSSGDVESLKVATMSIADLGAYFYALDSGLFTKYGVNVQNVDATAGSAAIASMMSGDVDLAYSGTDGAVKAGENGLAIKIVAGAGGNQPTGDKDSAGLVVAPGITEASQLEGKTLATMALGNVNQVYAQRWLKDQGVDVSTVKFVEIPSSEQVAALESGEIQGTILPEPFASQALANGCTIIGWPWRTGVDNSTLVSVWVASEATLTGKSNAVKKFLAAMEEATDYANDSAHRQQIVDAILSHTKLTSDVANNMTFVKWTEDPDPAKIKEVAQNLVDFGVLDSMPDVDSMVDISLLPSN
ncbi:MAG: ABC transporter substrate-binding protein [Ancrocorticia sp.]|nr:ABC transporter substrate-binding protein [Ancrocorticia sp.]MCI2193115.1 ABC transporter substrate-binding protein [Ancrocorticia sp.]